MKNETMKGWDFVKLPNGTYHCFMHLVFVMLLSASVGCQSLKKLMDGPTSTPAAPIPADITITGVTTSDFQLIPVRVLNSHVTVRVNRVNNPEIGWHDCDTFEVYTTTSGPGGGAVRLWYLNLQSGGVSFPVAPAGTPYEIRSVLNQ